ncbi:MAG: endonuclease/exonuclease/phosphatase family protein [Caulobacterales bacterium]
MRLILAMAIETARAGSLTAALICAAAALLALGGAVSGRLDVLAHFAPVWLAGGLVAIAAHVLLRPAPTPALLIAGLVAVAASLVLIGPEAIAALAQTRVSPGPGAVKIVQFNLWERNDDPKATADWILSENPDVIALEEADDAPSSILQSLAKAYPYRTTCDSAPHCSTVVLAKAAPSAIGGLDVAAGGGLRIPAVWARFGEGESAYTVVAAHYAWPIPPAYQAAQRERLAALLDTMPKESVILAGDFNLTPWSFALRRQDRRFGLERRSRAIFTWPAAHFTRLALPAPFPFLAIDQIYAGRAWDTVSVKRGPKLGSDHYPLVAVLRRLG